MIELLQFPLDLILNLDTHLVTLLKQYGMWLLSLIHI